MAPTLMAALDPGVVALFAIAGGSWAIRAFTPAARCEQSTNRESFP